MTSELIPLCAVDDIIDGRAKGVEVNDGRVFVVRRGNSLRAYHDICPHYGETSLPWRTDEYLDGAGEFIVCAAHGAKFEIDTGECVSGPCLGDYLTPVTIEVDDQGRVLARLDNE